jgi:dihydropteroate synthase
MKEILEKKVIQGRWYKINNKVKKTIIAKYDRIKDWRVDPKGYFLIDVDKKEKRILVGYCKIIKKKKLNVNNMVAIINGKSAIEIVNTLIEKKFVSTLQHAADMGIELNKAELAMKYKFKYIQDKDLIVI